MLRIQRRFLFLSHIPVNRRRRQSRHRIRCPEDDPPFFPTPASRFPFDISDNSRISPLKMPPKGARLNGFDFILKSSKYLVISAVCFIFDFQDSFSVEDALIVNNSSRSACSYITNLIKFLHLQFSFLNAVTRRGT